MISSIISRTSAAMLAIGGVPLLFAPDAVLPALVPGFPADAAWLGQLLAAAWLGIATLNWLQRAARLGGIYGRPLVLGYLAVHFISASSLVRALANRSAPAALASVALVSSVLAVAYALLLMRGPFDPLPSRGTP